MTEQTIPLIEIDSKIVFGGSLHFFSQEQIKTEPMLFNCDYSNAWRMGDEITQHFLWHLPRNWHNEHTVIDSRAHMLMPGFWPCIPGWHHDDVPRERLDGQPEYFNPSYRSEHCMALFNGGICPTQFALGKASLPDVRFGEVYYKQWHPMVQQLVAEKQLELVEAPSEQLIYFNDRTWHQGVQAKEAGWRFFIRASRNTGRKATNERRHQVQVYMDNPNIGW